MTVSMPVSTSPAAPPALALFARLTVTPPPPRPPRPLPAPAPPADSTPPAAADDFPPPGAADEGEAARRLGRATAGRFVAGPERTAVAREFCGFRRRIKRQAVVVARR